jgi:ABC-type amino acid transport substrate-binding protein
MEMRRNLAVIIVGLLAIVAIVAMVGCSKSGDQTTGSNSTGTVNSESGGKLPLSGRHLVIGVNAECAPYESIDKNGAFVGFDIDFAAELSKKLGFTHEWKDMEFFGLIGAVQEKRIDMAISALSGTEERKERVDFSRGYNYSIMCIISKPGSGIKTVADLAGKKVGAATGSNFEALITSVPTAKLISYDVTVPAVSLIGTPELDALVELTTFAEIYAAPLGLEAHVIPKSVAEELAGERPLSIAFPKGSELVPLFDKAILELEEEGIMDALAAKWFGQDYVDKLPLFNAKM